MNVHIRHYFGDLQYFSILAMFATMIILISCFGCTCVFKQAPRLLQFSFLFVLLQEVSLLSKEIVKDKNNFIFLG